MIKFRFKELSTSTGWDIVQERAIPYAKAYPAVKPTRKSVEELQSETANTPAP
ncbi:MAG: hypothetical protein KGL96_06615 [Hyphomicrobiales bacterium]|nr:hypothetical protein [Hyphomicrobiales bacterium]